MKRTSSLLLAFVFALTALILPQPAVAQSISLTGTWKIKGTHQTRGAYTGKARVKKDGKHYLVHLTLQFPNGKTEKINTRGQYKNGLFTFSYWLQSKLGAIGRLRGLSSPAPARLVRAKYQLDTTGSTLQGGYKTTRSPVVSGSETWTLVDTLIDYTEAELRRIAQRFAPIVYQEVDRGTFFHNPKPHLDYITGLDYDGDQRANNNWENVTKHKLLPLLYFSLVETETHLFISYSVYHPRDWSRWSPFPYVAHENDMENLQVVVEKASSGKPARVLLLLCQAHLWSEFVGNKKAGVKTKKGKFDGKLLLFNGQGKLNSKGKHPGIFIERKGHAIYPLGHHKKLRLKWKKNRLVYISKNTDLPILPIWEEFPIVEYIPSPDGVTKQAPTMKVKKRMDQKFEYGVDYGLVSIYHRYWKGFETGKFTGNGKLFDGSFSYKDKFFDLPKIPRYLDSNNWAGFGKRDAGISPFALAGNLITGKKGNYFFNPAWAYPKKFKFPGTWSTRYVYNPYLRSKLNKKAKKATSVR